MMSNQLKANRPLIILAAGIILVIVLVMVFGSLAKQQIRQLNQVAEDFYAHPFTVSNAAAELKSEITQMRIHMMQLAESGSTIEMNQLIDDTSLREVNARRQLQAIEKGFLGDMRKVGALKQTMDEWSQFRSNIITLVQNSKNSEASRLVSGRGNELYTRSHELIGYVARYAQNKAVTFENQAQSESRTMLRQLNWILSSIVVVIGIMGFSVLRLLYLHNKKLERDAYIDGLTGLLNRQQFYVLAQQEINLARRYSEGLSVLVLDIDHFKAINDRYGHIAGDVVLKSLSRILAESLRASDVICRWGGEEFVVLMPKMDAEGAHRIAMRINQIFAKNPACVGDDNIACTLSVGVTEYRAQNTIEELVNEADEALYKAKNSGRNRVITYVPHPDGNQQPPPVSGE